MWQVQPQRHSSTATGRHLGACAPAVWTPARLRIQGQRCPLRTRAATPAGHETRLTGTLWHLRLPLRREPPEGSGQGDAPGATGRMDPKASLILSYPFALWCGPKFGGLGANEDPDQLEGQGGLTSYQGPRRVLGGEEAPGG